MKSGELNTPISVYAKSAYKDAHYQRGVYNLLGMDWGKVDWLETIKDNSTETENSHDSSFAIARLTFRYEPLYIEHSSTNMYEFFGVFYEMVGMPTIRHHEGSIYISVKTRDDIGGITIV